MIKFRMYIDEVGNSDLESSDNPNHRFLSLTGVVLELDYAGRIVFPQMENLKSRYFQSHPDDPVVFHRKELVNGLPPFHPLKDADTRRRFDEELIALLTQWKYTVLTVCLDKKRHRETYRVWRYDPYHYCLSILLERYTFLLQRMQGSGDVLAESRGGKEDMRLKAAYKRLWEQGSFFMGPEQFQKVLTSSQLKVNPKSANISGLQLADLLAHPSRCEILAERGLLGRPPASFTARLIEILQTKYDRNRGEIFGKKWL